MTTKLDMTDFVYRLNELNAYDKLEGFLTYKELINTFPQEFKETILNFCLSESFQYIDFEPIMELFNTFSNREVLTLFKQPTEDLLAVLDTEHYQLIDLEHQYLSPILENIKGGFYPRNLSTSHLKCLKPISILINSRPFTFKDFIESGTVDCVFKYLRADLFKIDCDLEDLPLWESTLLSLSEYENKPYHINDFDNYHQNQEMEIEINYRYLSNQVTRLIELNNQHRLLEIILVASGGTRSANYFWFTFKSDTDFQYWLSYFLNQSRVKKESFILSCLSWGKKTNEDSTEDEINQEVTSIISKYHIPQEINDFIYNNPDVLRAFNLISPSSLGLQGVSMESTNKKSKALSYSNYLELFDEHLNYLPYLFRIEGFFSFAIDELKHSKIQENNLSMLETELLQGHFKLNNIFFKFYLDVCKDLLDRKYKVPPKYLALLQDFFTECTFIILKNDLYSQKDIFTYFVHNNIKSRISNSTALCGYFQENMEQKTYDSIFNAYYKKSYHFKVPTLSLPMGDDSTVEKPVYTYDLLKISKELADELGFVHISY